MVPFMYRVLKLDDKQISPSKTSAQIVKTAQWERERWRETGDLQNSPQAPSGFNHCQSSSLIHFGRPGRTRVTALSCTQPPTSALHRKAKTTSMQAKSQAFLNIITIPWVIPLFPPRSLDLLIWIGSKNHVPLIYDVFSSMDIVMELLQNGSGNKNVTEHKASA